MFTPHARGSTSCLSCLTEPWKVYPHARGSTFVQREVKAAISVYPACAGIDPPTVQYPAGHLCLPRMRGDRPPSSCAFSSRGWFTPHARGSTPATTSFFYLPLVFTPHARIDPVSIPVSLDGEPFTPHARGSTERTVAVERDIKVYPACAGIDPAASTASQASSRLPACRGSTSASVCVV